MTTASVTPRPSVVPSPIAAAPADDGLFGPESLTWRLFATPAVALSTTTAILAQMLLPRVMWMIDQSSSVWEHPEQRARLTAEYGATITYGDTAAAEQAGATLRNIHAHHVAVDPQTGESYRADQPDLLMWVHATIPWAILRFSRRWGPQLTPTDEDRFVAEQRITARLVGIEPASAPGSVAELDAYMQSMRPRLAFTAGCGRLLDTIVLRSLTWTAAGVLRWLAGRIALELLTPEQRRLYGVRWTRLDHLTAEIGGRLLVRLMSSKLPFTTHLSQVRAEAMAHAFGSRQRQTKAS